jgi:hypothetical protein
MESGLVPCLAKMRGIKPNKEYPSMAVSKFLHFYNPSLFPIYDYQRIWMKVCNGHFKKDYREFGDLEGHVWLNEDTESFIPFYMRWASSLLSIAHPSFMQVFAEWFYGQLGTKASERTFDACTLYAKTPDQWARMAAPGAIRFMGLARWMPAQMKRAAVLITSGAQRTKTIETIGLSHTQNRTER